MLHGQNRMGLGKGNAGVGTGAGLPWLTGSDGAGWRARPDSGTLRRPHGRSGDRMDFLRMFGQADQTGFRPVSGQEKRLASQAEAADGVPVTLFRATLRTCT